MTDDASGYLPPHELRGLLGEPSFAGRHQLFDIVSDPQQKKPLNDPKLEAHFAQRMAENLRAYGAPEEQLTRLGL